MITILCIQKNSNYKLIPGLDLWDEKRNAYNYPGGNITIAHPPCAQWSRLKGLANNRPLEKDLGPFCIDIVKKYGGIVEQPLGSSLFKHCGISKNIYQVNQKFWNFQANKETLLWCNMVQLLPYSKENYKPVITSVELMSKNKRSLMTLEFCNYLVSCCKF